MSIRQIAAFQDEAGNVDWKAYRAAQRENGELCINCEKWILPLRSGGPRKCSDCASLEEDSRAVDHDTHVRCPVCRHSWSAYDGDPMPEGTNSVYCDKCEAEFDIEVTYSVSYRSPAITA